MDALVCGDFFTGVGQRVTGGGGDVLLAACVDRDDLNVWVGGVEVRRVAGENIHSGVVCGGGIVELNSYGAILGGDRGKGEHQQGK
jgi:hypothetical protein